MLQANEFDLLLEALDSWIEKPVTDELVSGMLAAVLCRSDEEVEHYKVLAKEKGKLARDKSKIRKERATILAAKLISMRDKQVANEI